MNAAHRWRAHCSVCFRDGRTVGSLAEVMDAPPDHAPKSRVRLRLHVPLKDNPVMIVDTPIAVTVRQLKRAMEISRGIDASSQTLVAWGANGCTKMDDTRFLDSYRLLDNDRLELLPVVRAGPGLRNINGRSAIDQLADETASDLLQIMDEKLESHRSSDDVCWVLMRRGDHWDEGTTPSPSPSTSTHVCEQCEQSTVEATLGAGDQISRAKSPSSKDAEISNEVTKRKVEELKAKLAESRRNRESRSRSTDSMVLTSTSSTKSIPSSICDQCQSPTLFNDSGVCRICSGRFCAQHIIHTRHSCEAPHRCTACDYLVLIADDRWNCDECESTLCDFHGKQSCRAHRPVALGQKRHSESQCRQQ